MGGVGRRPEDGSADTKHVAIQAMCKQMLVCTDLRKQCCVVKATKYDTDAT
jgi:hypothetical protein